VTTLEQAISAFDEINDFHGLQDFYLSSTETPQDFIAVVWSLLNRARVRSAYLLAKLMYLRGVTSPVLALATYYGATDVGNEEDMALGRSLLRRLFDQHGPEQRKGMLDIFDTFIMNEVSIALIEPDLTPRMMRLLHVLREIIPELRDVLDVTTPAPAFHLPSVIEKGRAKAKLIPLVLPPAGAPRMRRRAIVAIRHLFFPQFNNSRHFEAGPTTVAAMRSYGWNATYLGLKFDKHEAADARTIAQICVQEQAEVLVVDAVIYLFPEAFEIMADLRMRMPALKIVGIYFDAWPIKERDLRAAAKLLDLVWTLSPDLAAWRHPEFNGKMFFAPFPRGGDFGGPVLPLQPKMEFIGGVAGYNWHRALWVAAMRSEKLPIVCHLTQFTTDGLTATESYLQYMRRLEDCRCAINFSMRANMTFIITGRTYDILAVGSLLVQERAEEIDNYFIEGEHYLPFTTFAELRAVSKFIQDRPDEAEDVRRKGNAFFRERYIDDKLIGYVDQRLFWPS